MKVVITSMRNEADYILEWVAWYVYLGFDKVVVFTNDNTDSTINELDKLHKKGVVEYYELTPPKESRPQMYAFNQGLKWLHENKPEWAMCADADEYLLLNKHNNINEFLNSFPADTDAIAINWKIFGSGNLNFKGNGYTIERFLLRAKDNYPIHSQFKSIFKYNNKLTRFHHRAIYGKQNVEKTKYYFSNGNELSDSAKRPGFKKEDSYINYDVAQLNHYTTRSIGELAEKMTRGNGFDKNLEENPRVVEYRKKFDKNDVYESNILDHLNGYMETIRRLKS